MQELLPVLEQAEMVVFVTPLYYFGMSAQLKSVVDRFYARNAALRGRGKRTLLLAAAYDDNDWTMRDLVGHYRTIVRYMNWHDAGMLLATGCESGKKAETEAVSLEIADMAVVDESESESESETGSEAGTELQRRSWI